jgi:hypothetical protein
MKIQIFVVLILVILISSQSTQSSTSSSSSSSSTTGGTTQNGNSNNELNADENQISGGGWFGNLFSSGEKETDSFFTPTSSVEENSEGVSNDDYDEFFSSEADNYFQ